MRNYYVNNFLKLLESKNTHNTMLNDSFRTISGRYTNREIQFLHDFYFILESFSNIIIHSYINYEYNILQINEITPVSKLIKNINNKHSYIFDGLFSDKDKSKFSVDTTELFRLYIELSLDVYHKLIHKNINFSQKEETPELPIISNDVITTVNDITRTSFLSIAIYLYGLRSLNTKGKLYIYLQPFHFKIHDFLKRVSQNHSKVLADMRSNIDLYISLNYLSQYLFKDHSSIQAELKAEYFEMILNSAFENYRTLTIILKSSFKIPPEIFDVLTKNNDHITLIKTDEGE